MFNALMDICNGYRDWISDNTSVIVKHHHLLDFISPGEHGGRRSPAVACWASDHWVASSNPLRGKFRH